MPNTSESVAEYSRGGKVMPNTQAGKAPLSKNALRKLRRYKRPAEFKSSDAQTNSRRQLRERTYVNAVIAVAGLDARGQRESVERMETVLFRERPLLRGWDIAPDGRRIEPNFRRQISLFQLKKNGVQQARALVFLGEKVVRG